MISLKYLSFYLKHEMSMLRWLSGMTINHVGFARTGLNLVTHAILDAEHKEHLKEVRKFWALLAQVQILSLTLLMQNTKST